MTNQGILQAQLKVKNSMNLENGFVDNPLLKSVEGEINLTDENSFRGFVGNTAIEHLDTVKSSSQNAVDLTNSLNNLSNLKYAKLEGNFNSNVEGKFSGNTAMQKLDLSESIQVKPEDFKDNNSLRELPKLDYSNPDLTDIITNDTNLKSTTIDLSNEPNTNKLGIHGDSTHQLGNLEFVKVNPEAPFDNQITPQIDVSYTSLNQNGLVNLFNTMPYNVGYTVVGTPTIVDGIFSSDSADSYVKTLNTYTVQNNDLIEFVYKYKPNLQVDNGYYSETGGLYVYRDYPLCNLAPYKENDGYAFRLLGAYKSGWGFNISFPKITQLPTGGYCFAKFLLNVADNKVSAYSSTDGISWTLVQDVTISNGYTFRGKSFFLQVASFTTTGTKKVIDAVDLNETYIKVNSIVSTGPVDYTVVGSPTITDGVASGFSSGNYIKTNANFDGTQQNYEIVIKAKRTSTGNNALFCHDDGQAGAFKLWFESSRLVFMPYSSLETLVISNNFIEGSYYYIRLIRNGNTFSLSYSLDKENWITQSKSDFTNYPTLTYTALRFGYIANWPSYFGGSIDLNETYFKVNGKLWFGHESKQVTWFNGAATRQLDPAATNVGNVTITNGVASGFSRSSRITAPKFDTTKPWEICIALKPKDTNNIEYILSSNFGIALLMRTMSNNRFLLSASSDGTNQDIIAGAVTGYFTANVPYLWKLTYDTEKYVSNVINLNTMNVINTYTENKSTPINSSFQYFNIGSIAYASPFTGSIDLNNTYIISNGTKIFSGMVPMTKTCSVVGCAGTADLTADDKAIVTGKGWTLKES